MTLAIKSLADGQLGTSKATLYTAGADIQTIVKKISYVNTSTSEVTVKFYFKASGGTSRQIDRAELGDRGRGIMKDEVTLEDGDVLEGEATIPSVVDYVISGVENS